MKRFWVSWWAKTDDVETPFDYWVSGSRSSKGDWDFDEWSVCAVIDAESEAEVWRGVGRYFPGYEPRFCDEKGPGYAPNDRFPGGGRTSLTARPADAAEGAGGARV